MMSDQEVIYNAVRDAWYQRLCEINLDVTEELEQLRSDVQQLTALLFALEQSLRSIPDDKDSTNTTKPKTKKQMAGVADTADDDKLKPLAESVRANRSKEPLKSKTSWCRRRA